MHYYRTPEPSEVDQAADYLGVNEMERKQMHAFYSRERIQNRAANIKLIKGVLRFTVEVVVIFLLSYAVWGVWTERLPK